MADGHEGATEETPAGEKVADQADGATSDAAAESEAQPEADKQ